MILLLAAALLLFAGCTAPPDGQDEEPTPEGITEMYITVNERKLEITLDENPSVSALVSRLAEGDITFTAYENGGFEIYGSIGKSLPTNNERITAQAGDVLLYAGNNLCFFYGSNTYSYTRIGRINGHTMSELKEAFYAEGGSVQVTISLN